MPARAAEALRAQAGTEIVLGHVEAFAGLTVGETIPLTIDMARAHSFAPGETGTALA